MFPLKETPLCLSIRAFGVGFMVVFKNLPQNVCGAGCGLTLESKAGKDSGSGRCLHLCCLTLCHAPAANQSSGDTQWSAQE